MHACYACRYVGNGTIESHQLYSLLWNEKDCAALDHHYLVVILSVIADGNGCKYLWLLYTFK